MVGKCKECNCAVLPGVGFRIVVENKAGEKEDEFLLCTSCFDAIMEKLEEIREEDQTLTFLFPAL